MKPLTLDPICKAFFEHCLTIGREAKATGATRIALFVHPLDYMRFAEATMSPQRLLMVRMGQAFPELNGEKFCITLFRAVIPAHVWKWFTMDNPSQAIPASDEEESEQPTRLADLDPGKKDWH